MSNIALSLGALVTVLSAVEAFFNHRGLWITRTVTVRRLEDLGRRVEYELAGRDELEISPELVDRLQVELAQIIHDDQQAWLGLRSADSTPGGNQALLLQGHDHATFVNNRESMDRT